MADKIVPTICVGCKYAWDNVCHKRNWCFAYRILKRLFPRKYYTPKEITRNGEIT